MKRNKLEIIKMTLAEERQGRKQAKITVFFLSLAMILFVGINSIVGSIQESTVSLLRTPFGYVLDYIDLESNLTQKYCTIKSKLSKSDMVKDVFYNAFSMNILWKDSKNYVGEGTVEPEVFAYFNGMSEYLTSENIKEPEAGEVVLPRYLYKMGIYDEYNYLDGNQLIGKTITLTFVQESGLPFEEKLKVIGTYDNVKASAGCRFLMNGKQLREIYQTANQPSEQSIQMMKEAMGSDYEKMVEQEYNGDEAACIQDQFQTTGRVSVYLNPEYDREEAVYTVNNLLGEKGMAYFVLDEDLILYYEFIIYLGNLTAVLFVVAAFANIMIMVSTEVRRRKSEFAVKMALGYERKKILLVFTLGKLCSFLKAVVYAIVITGGLILGGNYMIQMIFPFYLRHVRLEYSQVSIGIAVATVAVAAVLGLITAVPVIGRIQIAQVLKKEDTQ